MASIRFRSNKWQARVSRKGEQSLVKTFQSKEDAERWARSVEVEWDKGTYQNTHQAQKTTFGELIERYLREVTPLMRGAKEDTIRLKAILKKPIAKVNVLLFNSNRIAKYRDERLQEVSAGTVIRELAHFSSIINHARREWGINIANPVLLVRKPQSPQGRNRILSYAEEVELLKACEPKANRNIYTRPFIILALENNFKRARERVNLKDLRIHDLRHTAVTRLAEKLPNLIELSAVSGHRSLAMLKRYYHPKAEDIARKLA